MKKINRLKLKAYYDDWNVVGHEAYYNNWNVVGHDGLQFCGKIMSRFGLETGSAYIMSIRTTPKNKTHFKVTMSISHAGFWEWQCDAVPLGIGNSYERFFNHDLKVKVIMSKIVEPGTVRIDLWIKFRKIS